MDASHRKICGACPSLSSANRSLPPMGGRRVGRIVAVESRKHLTGSIMGAVMSYMLVPVDHRHVSCATSSAMARSRTYINAIRINDP